MRSSAAYLNDDALPALFRLYQRTVSFPPANGVERYWNWKFRSNAAANDSEVYFLVVNHGEELVASLGALPVVVDANRTPIESRWTVDFMVDPTFRGRGLGKLLFARFHADNPLAICIGAPLRSATTRIACSVGFRPFTLRYLFKFYGHRALATRFPRLAGLLSIIAPVAPRLLRSRRAIPKAVTCDLHEVQMFGPDVNEFWASLSREWPVSVRRTDRLLNWKYFESPLFHYRAAEVRRDGRLVGFLVLKVAQGIGLTYGTIPEIATSACDHEAQAALLSWALEQFETARVDVVKVLASTPRQTDMFSYFGFVPLGKKCAFLIASAPELPSVLADGSNWFLTKGDSDLDITPDFERVVASAH